MFSSMKKPSRLGQWNGRRRSSRSDEPMLPHLWRRPVLLRLAAVLVAAAAVTFLAYRWGPPLPYRLGEIYSWDLRVRVDFELVNQAQTEKACDAAVEHLVDPVLTERVRRAVGPIVERYPRDMLLVPRGQPIKERHLSLLQEE